MKIGLVLPAVPAYSETFFINKIRGLQSYGHEVILFVNAKTSLSFFEGAPIRISPSTFRNPIRMVTQFLRLVIFHFKAARKFYQLEQKDQSSFILILKRMLMNSHLLCEQLDWLHFGFGTMALDRENVAEAIHTKMAVSFRGYDHYVYPLKNINCYAKLFSKEIKYHVLSEGMRKTLIQKGIPSAQIVIIMPAINLDLFSKREKTNDNRILQIVTIARLHWIKGLESTLEALDLLKQKGVSFHYSIVGEGPEKERLQFAAHQLGLQEHVTFTGKLSPVKVKEILEESDVYLQYSFQEGFCNAVLEAQAMGKICVVSDAEGLSENVLDGITGFVVVKRNTLSLANKIFEVTKMSESERKRMTEKAVVRVKEEFNIDKQSLDFLEFYKLD